MQIHLRKKKLQDGRESLYLDIYKDGKRSYEFLKLYIKRGDPNNKEMFSLAEKTRSKRLIELANNEFEQISSQKRNASLIKYFEKFCETKRKWTSYYATLKYLKIFEPQEILFKQVNKNWLDRFSNYLSKESGLKRNTASLYFTNLKEVLYRASREGYIRTEVIRTAITPGKERVERGYLELKELQKLVNTPSDRPDISKPFLFSCFTGLRQSDVRNLRWKDISDNTIKIKQQKTNSSLSIPLSQTALNILNTENIIQLLPDNKIFKISKDRTMINRALTRWFKLAGIDKKAYYHLSRHTFATLNLTSGNEIYTVSKLLGHKSLKTTEIYAKIIDEKKKEAMDNLPVIEMSL